MGYVVTLFPHHLDSDTGTAIIQNPDGEFTRMSDVAIGDMIAVALSLATAQDRGIPGIEYDWDAAERYAEETGAYQPVVVNVDAGMTEGMDYLTNVLAWGVETAEAIANDNVYVDDTFPDDWA